MPFFAAWRAAIARNFYINVASHYHILQLKKESMHLRAVARPNGKQLIKSLLRTLYSTFENKCSFGAREIGGIWVDFREKSKSFIDFQAFGSSAASEKLQKP